MQARETARLWHLPGIAAASLQPVYIAASQIGCMRTHQTCQQHPDFPGKAFRICSHQTSQTSQMRSGRTERPNPRIPPPCSLLFARPNALAAPTPSGAGRHNQSLRLRYVATSLCRTCRYTLLHFGLERLLLDPEPRQRSRQSRAEKLRAKEWALPARGSVRNSPVFSGVCLPPSRLPQKLGMQSRTTCAARCYLWPMAAAFPWHLAGGFAPLAAQSQHGCLTLHDLGTASKEQSCRLQGRKQGRADILSFFRFTQKENVSIHVHFVQQLP